jgi:hypothetical protein
MTHRPVNCLELFDFRRVPALRPKVKNGLGQLLREVVRSWFELRPASLKRQTPKTHCIPGVAQRHKGGLIRFSAGNAG